MLARRSLLPATAVAATAMATAAWGAALFCPRASAQDAAAGGAAFIRAAADQLVGVISGPGSTTEKQAKLQAIIDRTVDVDGIARFCLGRFYREASEAQQQEYISLFHAVLLKSVTGKLGEYSGVTVAVGHAQTRDDGIVVSSVVTRPNNQPNNVDWLLEAAGGSFRIIDVVAEGTSLRLTQRSDYNSFLSRNGGNIQALIDAMRKQVVS